MIVLESGLNQVVVTLKEKATLTNPVYIFLFVNDNTNNKYYCTTTDVSGFPDRFNQFALTVKANPTWTAGEVSLDDYGFYHYYVYERANLTGLVYNTLVAADIRDLVPTYFTTLVESGKMKYLAPDESDNYYADLRGTSKSYGL